jgi:hypothetical protein
LFSLLFAHSADLAQGTAESWSGDELREGNGMALYKYLEKRRKIQGLFQILGKYTHFISRE